MYVQTLRTNEVKRLKAICSVKLKTNQYLVHYNF